MNLMRYLLLFGLMWAQSVCGQSVATQQLIWALEHEGASSAREEVKLDPELESIFEKHREAVLGVRSPESVRALKIKGVYLAGDQQLPFVVYKMRDHFFRLEMQAPSGLMIQAYDGERGWLIPASSDPDTGARWMDKQANAAMERDALLFDYMIEYERESVEATRIHNGDGESGLGVQVELANGGLINYWLDPETFLTIREVKVDYAEGGFRFRTVELSDFREIDGVRFAHRAMHYFSGELESELRIESIEILDNLPVVLFAAPIVETAAGLGGR